MKKYVLALLLALIPSALLCALPVPPLVSHVNDYAGMLSKRAAQDLERDLTEFEKSDSTQIVVLTIPSLRGENLEEFSMKVAEAWRIGWKGVDNGVILLIARDERKARIEVGRGLEGKLTDLTAGSIIRNRIAPKFKEGDFDGGMRDGIQSIMEAVRGEFEADRRDLRHARKSAPPIFTLLIFLFIALVFAGAVSKILGGAAGAIGLPVVGKLALPALSLGFLGALALAGLILGLFISLLFGAGHGRGRGGTRAYWGGPFFGGGGGGGFGGFSGGGGDFGGGGASGDW